jgi:hypothetical protein
VAGWAAWARSQLFIVCWKRSTLPWVWGWFGLPFFWVMPYLFKMARAKHRAKRS